MQVTVVEGIVLGNQANSSHEGFLFSEAYGRRYER